MLFFHRNSSTHTWKISSTHDHTHARLYIYIWKERERDVHRAILTNWLDVVVLPKVQGGKGCFNIWTEDIYIYINIKFCDTIWTKCMGNCGSPSANLRPPAEPLVLSPLDPAPWFTALVCGALPHLGKMLHFYFPKDWLCPQTHWDFIFSAIDFKKKLLCYWSKEV